MAAPYTIRVSSTKGGVGKSTVTVNLGTWLQLFGYKVLLVDLDTVNPSVGLYLGMPNVNIGVDEVITDQVQIERAIVPHSATGLHVLPGVLKGKYTLPIKEQLDLFLSSLMKLDYDFVLFDTQPGIPTAETLEYYNEALVITLPDEASCLSAVKMLDVYKSNKIKTSVLVNRVANQGYELTIREIEALCEQKVTGVLPEDVNVKISIAEHIPLVLKNRSSPFSKQIDNVGHMYSTRSATYREGEGKGKLGSFLGGLFKKG